MSRKIKEIEKEIYVLAMKIIAEIVPDTTFLKISFFIHMKERLYMDRPQTFNEKLQWLKIHDRNLLYTTLVDKYEVREFIKNKIGEQYLIPLLGVWDNLREVSFQNLPQQFVLKCTHDSGGLIICRDKSKLSKDNLTEYKRVLSKSLKRNYYFSEREWPYKDVKPRIIAEKLIQEDIIDYKFYCFNGIPKFLYISQGLEDHSTARISFLKCDWTRAEFGRSDYREFEEIPEKPEKYDTMLEIAGKLSKNIPFVRVDLYYVNRNIYFSEMTFFPVAGYMPFKPKKYDRIVGKLLELPENR